MVIKTEACYYTEFRIYPGRGIHIVRKDGKPLAFITRKARSLFQQKIKAQKLTWTQQWRRRNKKGKVEDVQKRRTKRSARTYKAIQGLDLEALNKRRTMKAEVRKANREAQLRQIKERKRKAAAEKKDKKPAANKSHARPATFQKVPKLRQKLRQNVRR